MEEQNNIIADKLDAVIKHMFRECKSLSPSPQEYFIFGNIKESNPVWFILILFPDAAQLNEAIKTGVCYLIFDYMWGNLNHLDDFKDLKKALFFESGKLPEEEKDFDKIFSAASKKLDTLKKEVGQSYSKICSICGHSNDKHMAAKLSSETADTPLAGWMMCSEELCNCFGTWDGQIIDK